MFSQCCQECSAILTADFCNEETCRRKFIPQPGYSRISCPLHDPALSLPGVSRGRRLRVFKRALHCSKCETNLFGIKPEDLVRDR